MPSCTLSAYVLAGESTLDPAAVVKQVNHFISSRKWACPDVWAVSQQGAMGEGELGLNLVLPEPHHEPEGWVQDIEAVVAFCVHARRELQRDFVIGIASADGRSEDITEIDSESPNVEYIKRFIGIEPPSGDA